MSNELFTLIILVLYFFMFLLGFLMGRLSKKEEKLEDFASLNDKK